MNRGNLLSEQESSRPTRKVIFLILRLVLGVLIFFGLCQVLDDFPSLTECIEIWHGIKLLNIFGVFLICICVMLLRGIRWTVLMRFPSMASLSEYVAIYGWSFAHSIVTPFRIGDMTRLLWMKERGFSGSKGAGVLVAERFLDFAVLLFLLLMASSVLPSSSALFSLSALPVLIVFLFGYAVFSFYSGRLASLLKRQGGDTSADHTGWAWRLHGLSGRFLSGLQCLSHSRTHLLGLLMTLMIWLLMAAAFHLFLKSFFADLPIMAAALVLTLVNFAAFLNLTPCNIGPYELTGIYGLAQFGYSAPWTLGIVAGLHIFNFSTFMLFGFLCKLYLWWGKR